MQDNKKAIHSLLAAVIILVFIVVAGVIWLFVAGPLSGAARTQVIPATTTATSTSIEAATSPAQTEAAHAAATASTEDNSSAASQPSSTSTTADKNLTNVTGIYMALGSSEPTDYDNSFIKSAVLKDGVLTLEAHLNPAFLSQDGYIQDPAQGTTQTWRFAVDDATLWTGSGGTGGTWAIQRDELIGTLNDDTGLGVTFNVKDGYLVSADISS